MRPLVLLLWTALASRTFFGLPSSDEEEEPSSTTALLGTPDDWNRDSRNPWEKEESCCAPSHRPSLHINGQDSDELSHTVASLHNILLLNASTSVLSTGLFSVMLYCHSSLCVGEYLGPMLAAWTAYMLSTFLTEGLIVWEITLMIIGFLLLDDVKAKVMIALASISTLLPMTQLFGLMAFKNKEGHLDPLDAICNLTTPVEGFTHPRWLATQILPGTLMVFISVILMCLNSRMLVSYRSRIQFYD